MNTANVQAFASAARSKFSREADRADLQLRLLVGHASPWPLPDDRATCTDGSQTFLTVWRSNLRRVNRRAVSLKNLVNGKKDSS